MIRTGRWCWCKLPRKMLFFWPYMSTYMPWRFLTFMVTPWVDMEHADSKFRLDVVKPLIKKNTPWPSCHHAGIPIQNPTCVQKDFTLILLPELVRNSKIFENNHLVELQKMLGTTLKSKTIVRSLPAMSGKMFGFFCVARSWHYTSLHGSLYS